MKQIAIYKYEGTYETDSGETKSSTVITVANIPGAPKTEMARLIADDGMVLSNDGGNTFYKVVDVLIDEVSSWSESLEPEPSEQNSETI